MTRRARWSARRRSITSPTATAVVRPGACRAFSATLHDGDGFDVDLDDDTFAALRQEAAGQGVDPSRLAEHALLYYLADLDGGRLAERIGGAFGERKNPPR